MEGKKKRWRPSLAAYRELEQKLESQIEGTSLLVSECAEWRKKYRSLSDEHESLLRRFNDLQHASGRDGRGFWARVFNRK